MSTGAERLALYPGSFDPPTNGHVDLIERALHVFDKLIVAVATNAEKECLFTVEERVEMLKEATAHIKGVEVESFDTLTVEYAKARGAIALIRGLRAVSDFEYELQMALMNRKLDPSIETIYLMPSEAHIFLSSSLLKEIVMFGGKNLSDFVPPTVERRLLEKFGKKKT
jgi:pantetheine-phosphate adenylyltransferase